MYEDNELNDEAGLDYVGDYIAPSSSTEGNDTGGRKTQVTYVGNRPAFYDTETKRKFRRNEPTTVDADDADRLLSLGGDREVFVRSTN